MNYTHNFICQITDIHSNQGKSQFLSNASAEFCSTINWIKAKLQISFSNAIHDHVHTETVNPCSLKSGWIWISLCRK